jgi:RNA polymerase sigma-70 factor (ECF subfamily)
VERDLWTAALAGPEPLRSTSYKNCGTEKALPEMMNPQECFRGGLVGALPGLRAFAISLAHDVNVADDLVQETILRAWNAIDRFEPGTNLNAWLFTILRNQFLTAIRKAKREIEDPDGGYAARQATPPTQNDRVDFQDLRAALARLPVSQREAVLLVGASGLPYEEAAEIIGVPVGTVKSRVNRARASLAAMLSTEAAEDLGADALTRAAMQIAA